jgi:dsDNA-binding SOS-regulon protein
MRNVSGYLTDDGRFFQDKKEAEAHERFLSINNLIEEFVRDKYTKVDPIQDTLRAWEKYKQDAMK